MLVVFASKSMNTVNIVSYRRVEPFGMILMIDSDSKNKLFDNRFTDVAPHILNIV